SRRPGRARSRRRHKGCRPPHGSASNQRGGAAWSFPPPVVRRDTRPARRDRDRASRRGSLGRRRVGRVGDGVANPAGRPLADAGVGLRRRGHFLRLHPVALPVTRYARSGDVSIAYQVLGDGPLDLVFVHGFIGNMDVQAENPQHEAFFEQLASVGRVIRFDRRGTGLSDRVREVPTLEARMDDLRAVMDAATSRRAALITTFEAGSMAMVYAATYPERVSALALYNPVAKGTQSPDYPWAGQSESEWEAWIEQIRTRWGDPELLAGWLREGAPTIA